MRETLAGTPQGGMILPLLANIYLNKPDRIWAARCEHPGVLVRYAEDFVAMCRTESQAREALRRIGLVMNRLGLTLHSAKTKLVDLRRGKEGFLFFGRTIRKKRSIQRVPDKHFMQRWPCPKATKKLRDRVRELTGKRQSGKDADREFDKMDYFVAKKLRRRQYRRGGQRPAKRAPFTGSQLHGMGLHKLMGTVKYPTPAISVRSSLSRVRENRIRALKGGVWKRADESRNHAGLLPVPHHILPLFAILCA